MIASKTDIMNAYIKVGPRADNLLAGHIKVNFFK